MLNLLTRPLEHDEDFEEELKGLGEIEDEEDGEGVPSVAGLRLRKLLYMRKFSFPYDERVTRIEQEKLGELKLNLEKTQEELKQACSFGVNLLKKLARLERDESKKEMFMKMISLENKKLKREKTKLEGEVYELRQRIVGLEISERENEILRRDYDRVLEINRSLRSKNETYENEMKILKMESEKQRANLERKSSRLHLAKIRLKREEEKLLRRTSGIEKAKRRLHNEEKVLEKKKMNIENVKVKMYREEAILGRKLSQLTIMRNERRTKKIRGSESFYYLCGKVSQTLKEMRSYLAKLRSEFCETSNMVNDKMESFLAKLPEVVNQNQVCVLDGLEYARIQKGIVEDLGLMEFYETGVLRPKKEGFVEIWKKSKWKPFYIVISHRMNSLSVYVNHEKREFVERITLHGIKLFNDNSGNIVLRNSQSKTVIMIRVRSNEMIFEWSGMIESVIRNHASGVDGIF